MYEKQLNTRKILDFFLNITKEVDVVYFKIY